jgi:hypothetical protein
MNSFPIDWFWVLVQPEDVALARSAAAIEQLSIARPPIQKSEVHTVPGLKYTQFRG